MQINNAVISQAEVDAPKSGYNTNHYFSLQLDADGNTTVRGKDSTSWDSFSYAIQMGHNVWSHINAVQEANRQYDAGVVPKMLVQEKFDRVFLETLSKQYLQQLQEKKQTP